MDYWREKEINKLIQVIAKTNSDKEVRVLFDRILTPREINDMAKRLEIVRLLDMGTSYLEIQDILRVSPTTIGRVANQIGFGFRRTSKKIAINNKKPIHKYSPRGYKGSPAVIKRIIPN